MKKHSPAVAKAAKPATNPARATKRRPLKPLKAMLNAEPVLDGKAKLPAAPGPSAVEACCRYISAAIDGTHGDSKQIIALEGVELVKKVMNKNDNYGSSVFHSPRLLPELSEKSAILVRMGDKISRLEHLAAGNADLVGESFTDTVADLAGYCLLYLAATSKLPVQGRGDVALRQ